MNFVQLDLFSLVDNEFAPQPSAPSTSEPAIRRNFSCRNIQLATGAAARIRDNLAAIRILKQDDLSNLSCEQQETLAKFSGWGGLTGIFTPEDPAFSELKSLLSSDEYETAAGSMLDSYFFAWRMMW